MDGRGDELMHCRYQAVTRHINRRATRTRPCGYLGKGGCSLLTCVPLRLRWLTW
jgi:hypothetical protein